MFRWRLVGLLFGSSLVASPVHAQERSQPTHDITLERALELARQQGPNLTSAKARVNEARGRIEGASHWRFNPQLGAFAGPRYRGTNTGIDWGFEAEQWLELGGQGGDRLALAQAGVDVAEARRQDAERLLLREVGLKFIHALYWQRRVELAQENLRIAEDIAQIARRRHEVGESGGLDESIALLALARTKMSEAHARAALSELEGHLKILIGFDAGVQLALRGNLRTLGARAGTLPTAADERPDLQALSAELRAAKAEAQLGRDARIPNLALGASYSREEGAAIVQGSLALTLPVFNHGQGARAVAGARSSRIDTELSAARRRAAIEVESANQRSQWLSAVARQFEGRGLATLNQSNRVATASYEAGAIPLGELLAVRRELVQAKLDYAGVLLGAAAARIELIASADAWR